MLNQPQTEQTPLLIGMQEASKLLGISDRTLHSLKQAGTIPHVRIGHRVLFSVGTLRSWIAEQEKGGA